VKFATKEPSSASRRNKCERSQSARTPTKLSKQESYVNQSPYIGGCCSN